MNHSTMPSPQEREAALFALTAEKPVAERPAFLDAVCGQDSALRQRLEALLAAHEQPATALDAPTVPARPTLKLDLPEPPDEAVGQTLGRYKLLERVGEGGCGVVYVAEQTEPVRRLVALKVIKLGMDTKQVVARFEAERQALAMMDHPNIAKVLDAGTTDVGRPYFVMELVRGIPITHYCDQANLSTKERLDLFIKVCQAIQHAHQKGIIHRDIKPSNILVTLHDGVPVPKVIDFGIAKATEGRLTDNTVYTQLHQFIGTPAYMSPEQAEMSGLDIDTRSDIYSLGVLLYELLAGSTPFDAKELMSQGIDVMRKTIREKEPQRPSTRLATLGADQLTTTARRRSADTAKLLHQLKGDLDWIVMKCLEKDRTRRYESASGLAADLKRHLENEPVVARPPSQLYRFQKAYRRNRLAFTAAACVLVSLVGALVFIGMAAQREGRAHMHESIQRNLAEQRRQEAEAARTLAENAQAKEAGERQRAEASERATRELLYSANMGLAQTAWEEGDIGRLQGLLAQTRDDPQRGFEWFYWARQLHRDSLTFREHRGVPRRPEFSPDGQWIASSGDDLRLKIWSATDGQVRHDVKLDQLLSGLAFSPDGGRLATATQRPWKLQLWDALTGQILREIKVDTTNAVRNLAWSPEGSRIIGVDTRAVWLWDASTNQELRRITNYHGEAVLTWFSPEGRPQIAVRDETGYQLQDVATGEALARFDAPGAVSETISRDLSRFAASADNGVISLFEVRTGRELRQWRGSEGPTWLLRLSPDGKYLATTEGNGTIRLRDTDSGEELGTLKGHSRQIFGLAFSPDGQRLVSASGDETIRVWDWPGLMEPASLFARHPRLQVFLSSDGSRAVVVTNRTPGFRGWVFGLPNRRNPDQPFDVEARVVDTRTGQTQAVLPGLTGGVVQFTPDGRRVAGVSTNLSRAQVWDALTGRVLVTLDAGTNLIADFRLSPDGRQIVTVERHPSQLLPDVVKLWDSITGKIRFSLKEVPTPAIPLAFSADSRRLLTGAPFDPFAVVWNTMTGQEESRIEATALSGVVFGAFSPDGERVIMASFLDAMMRVRSMRSPGAGTDAGFVLHSRIVGPNPAFSPDGHRILSETEDKAKLWDAATGREMLTLKTPPYARCQFTPDGQAVISARPDGTLLRWDIATPAQVAAWEAEEDVGTLRKMAATARNSTSSLLRSRRYTELETTSREMLKSLQTRSGAEPAEYVEFTLRLATALLSHAVEADAKGEKDRAETLKVEAGELLRGIANERLDAYLRTDPGYEMGDFLGQAGHWSQTEAFVRRISETVPTNSIPWKLRATLLARMGNEPEFAKVRDNLLELLPGLTNTAHLAWGIRAVALRPLDASTAATVERLANRKLELDQDEYSESWLPLAQALARYRNRDFAGALTSVQKAAAATDHASFETTLHAVTALVRYQLGQRQEASAALNDGAALLKENWFSPERGALEGDGWWIDWLSAHILLQEARELIEGQRTNPEALKP
ncbi:MAG: protein kinase [Verrucomicrobiae bacterium]|nr:protein kinase [Verrucomicrobiae bacterium]